MPNFRDAGGHPTVGGGVMRAGLLYRSDHVDHMTADEAGVVARLGIKVVYDLRTEAERMMAPDVHIPATTGVQLDLMADDRQAAPAQLLRLLEHPRVAMATLGNGRAVALFVQGYRSIVTLPSARAGLQKLYGGLLDPEGLPALCHCTTGKDRTGWTCAALQSLLGVPRDEVLRDFLASNHFILPKYRSSIDEFAARGGDPALLLPVLSVLPEYLEASFDEVRRAYGSIEGYFEQGLGLDTAAQSALRERFVSAADGLPGSRTQQRPA